MMNSEIPESSRCQRCSGQKVVYYTAGPCSSNGFITPAIHAISSSSAKICTCEDSPAKHHDGDLGHNAMVSFDDCRYSADDGSTFYLEEVLLSDKMRHVYLTPGEALSLLDWLTQEKATLQRLVEEQR